MVSGLLPGHPSTGGQAIAGLRQSGSNDEPEGHERTVIRFLYSLRIQQTAKHSQVHDIHLSSGPVEFILLVV
jgi:hypothetical protein